MMPLSLLAIGESSMVQKVGGSGELKSHLADLGFVAGSEVSVVSTLGGNLIVSVKDTRVAISKEMANRIMVH